MKRSGRRPPKLTPKRQEKREQRKRWAIEVRLRDPMCRMWMSGVRNGRRCPLATTEAHHMLPRSQGGTDEMWNGIGLCRSDHMWIHNHRIEAQALGLLAHVGDESPWPREEAA